MRLGVGAAAVLLLLLAGTPVTAPPRLNLAALLDYRKANRAISVIELY